MPGKIVSSDATLAELLVEWQDHGEVEAFNRLWSAAASGVYRVARAAIVKAGSRDKAAADDAVSLVMDHLRRLPAGSVARYDPRSSASQYLRWLTTRRVQDAIRSCRRRHRQEKPLSPLLDAGVPQMGGMDPDEAAARDSLVAALISAMAKLDSRSQQVLSRHLAGERQASIAEQLGVCEGAVTRIRQRAIEQLRRWLSDEAEKPERPKPR